MPKLPVNFYTEDIPFTLTRKTVIRKWLNKVITAEGYELDELNFIFCSDAYLLILNQKFLNHDTYTDVITFDNSERPKIVAGDIFISLDRVKENAALLDVSPLQELKRVMVHGTLHLLGYTDKKKADKLAMTAREDHYLADL